MLFTPPVTKMKCRIVTKLLLVPETSLVVTIERISINASLCKCNNFVAKRQASLRIPPSKIAFSAVIQKPEIVNQ